MRRTRKLIQGTILSLHTLGRDKAKNQKLVIIIKMVLIIKILNRRLMKSLNNNRNMGSFVTKATTKVRLRLQMKFPQQCFAISATRRF